MSWPLTQRPQRSVPACPEPCCSAVVLVDHGPVAATGFVHGTDAVGVARTVVKASVGVGQAGCGVDGRRICLNRPGLPGES